MSRPHPPGLPLAQVRAQLKELTGTMTPKQAQRLRALLELPGWEADCGCIRVAAVLPLFATDDPAKANSKPHEAANKALDRLVKYINAAADKRRDNIRFRARLSTQRQGGPEVRYLWFEGEKEPPAQRTDEWDSAGPVVQGQRAVPGHVAPPSEPPPACVGDLKALRESGRHIRDQCAASVPFSWQPDRAVQAPPPTAPKTVVALDHLVDWVSDPDAAPLMALLGEYGMGKTITCQTLLRYVETHRQTKPEKWPRVLYFDLRLITGLGLDRPVPTLQQVVEECMNRGWQADAASGAYRLDDVLTWAAGGALIIFDGLDEVLVKLTAADGQTLTRSLLGLPALVAGRVGDRTAGKTGSNIRGQSKNQAPAPRLLISCRTHYFRTLADQQNHFTGQQRTGPAPATYRALLLLPFTDAQVAAYLKAAFPGQDIARLQETIAAIHDLGDLTRRPYTLEMVADQLPDIEAARADGQPVYAVRLYRGLTARWLHRDQGKHHIRADHKQRLATHLAALLWREGSGLLPIARLEDWLHAWLADTPELRARYARLHPEQLEEDLRTATFLIRDDKGNGGFRFAHTSLLEYFLAEYLFAALRADRPADWLLPTPSPETLDFFGQLLAEADEPALLTWLTDWGAAGSGGRQAAVASAVVAAPARGHLVLAYALRALAQGWPVPSLRGLVLAGADLSDQIIAGPANGPLLDLREADLTGCTLRRVRFERVRLSGARLRDTDLAQATWLHCEATGTDWSGAACDGAIWRLTNLTGARWDGARGQGSRFIRCADPARNIPGISSHVAPRPDSDPYLAPSASKALKNRSDYPARPLVRRPSLALLTGHRGAVCACAFSPDGTRFLSGGEDGTMRLWDAATGTACLVCRGHQSPVSACAFSPDGTRILSAGADGKLRLWEAASGTPLWDCSAHLGPVSACAVSPDGARLLSAGEDGNLRLWDAATGALLRDYPFHHGSVRACAFSPDGTFLLLSSNHGTLHLWSAASGTSWLNVRGHEDQIGACAFSPDGTRVLSASDDGSLRLWDVGSGASLLVCRGHEGSVSACAFSPDGTRLLSASTDQTLRLWDAGSGATLAICRGHDVAVNACAYSPDGSRLLSDVVDSMLRVWDATNGVGLAVCVGHERSVTACAFSPDGDRLLSASNDRTLCLWDAASGQRLMTYAGHKEPVIACAISVDGTQLLSASDDRTLRRKRSLRGVVAQERRLCKSERSGLSAKCCCHSRGISRWTSAAG